MATKSLTSSSPPVPLDAPLLTILDLWYARNGARAASFLYEQIEYAEGDDWLMQNMALVVKGVVRGDISMVGERWEHHVGPYRVRVYLDTNKHTVEVVVFMKDEQWK